MPTKKAKKPRKTVAKKAAQKGGKKPTKKALKKGTARAARKRGTAARGEPLPGRMGAEVGLEPALVKDSIDTSASPRDRYTKLRAIIENVLSSTDAGDENGNKRKWISWFFLYLMWWESSEATARTQGGNGPARGLIQMEPATFWDLYDKYMRQPPARKQAVVKNLALASGETETQVETSLDDFWQKNKPATGSTKPKNSWPTAGEAKKVEAWLRDVDSFAILVMRYQFKRSSSQNLPPDAASDLAKNPQDEVFKDQHAKYWADWWKRDFPDGDRDEQMKKFKQMARKLDTIAQ